MVNKIKYDPQLISQANKLFPEFTDLHVAMRLGKTQPALDLIFSRVGFILDEDDVIRAFKNKKEHKIFDLAKKAKEVRDFYQKMFVFVDKHEGKFAEKNSLDDCF